MFKPNPLYLSDGYKVGHPHMIAPGTTKEYWTKIPRSLKYGPKGATHIVSAGSNYVWRWLNDLFVENFFNVPKEKALIFSEDMSTYLMLPYDGSHFNDLYNLGYLPLSVKALPEGVETLPNIPHETGVNTVDGFAWLGLYVETITSMQMWKMPTSATIAKQFRLNADKAVKETDEDNMWFVDFMCHDFSCRGMGGMDSAVASGMGHAMFFKGSDSLITIPSVRYYYPTGDDRYMPINSVNASEHSVSMTKIATVGETQMLIDWMEKFPTGILSVVMDTFDITEVTRPDNQGILYNLKEKIVARDGKLVIRPDSNPEPLSPVEIICGWDGELTPRMLEANYPEFYKKGLIQCLWETFGGTVNSQGFKVLNDSISAIYGDAISIERQIEIYKRLKEAGFAATNIILGIGSYTYQMNSRDTCGWAIKGAAFENGGKWIPIYKDPITDDGTKKSLKGFQMVYIDDDGEYKVKSDCTIEEEAQGELREIFRDGEMLIDESFETIRERVKESL